MADIIIDVESAEITPPLPAQSTDHPLYKEVENYVNQGNWQAAKVPLKELMALYPDDLFLQQIWDSLQE